MEHILDGVPNAALEVGAALVSSLEFEMALANVVQKIGEALDVSSVGLWRCSQKEHQVSFEAFWSRDGHAPRDAAPVGTVIDVKVRPDIATLIACGEQMEHHPQDGDSLRYTGDMMEPSGYRSLYEAPLVVGGEILGSLVLAESRAARRFTDVERTLLTQLCQLAAIAIHNAELYRRMDEQKRRAVSLLEASRATAVSRGAPHAVDSMRAEIGRLLPGVDVDLEIRIDLGAGQMLRFVGVNEGGALAFETPASPPDALARKALEERGAVQNLTDERLRVVVPLELRGGVWGFVELRTRLHRKLTDDETDFVQTLAHHASAAFEQARLRRQLTRRAVIDPQTGLFSTPVFRDRLLSEITRSYRYKQSVTLIMMSIDGYGSFIDADGKPIDRIVRLALSRFLKRSLRRHIDIACRYADNEIAIVLPNTALANGGAVKAAERLRSTIATYDFRNEDDESLGEITVTLGVACYPNHADDADDLAEVAESALKAARKKGTNRVELSRG